MERPDLLARLADFDHYGLTATERLELRTQAWQEIRKLREEVKRLKAEIILVETSCG